MALTKDDIDAVAINLLVDGTHTFLVYLTRGGLTQRMGSSDRVDANAVRVKAATDYFEPFLATVPDALLQGESAAMEDGGRDGPRHDWRFEFAGGMNSLVYDISYHAGSAGLPDEFADMVVQAERLTHSWYLAGVAEETGVPLAAAKPAVAPPPPKPAAPAKRPAPSRASTAARSAPPRTRPRSGPSVPASRQRIALAILIDFLALSIPYAFVAAMMPDGGVSGPPGAGLVLFAIVEFLLLMIARRSLGYWLLGMHAPPQGKPLVDSAQLTRESKLTLTVGVLLFWSGASGITSWTVYHTPVPYFGLPLGAALSILMTVLLAVASLVAGALILRTDVRGCWVGAGVMSISLLAVVLAWDQWDAWMLAELNGRAALEGRTLDGADVGMVQSIARALLVGGPVLMLAGVGASWKRFQGKLPSAAPVVQTAR